MNKISASLLNSISRSKSQLHRNKNTTTSTPPKLQTHISRTSTTVAARLRTSTSITAKMAAREAYQIPTAQQPSSSSNVFAQAAVDGPVINYLCGDCNAKVPLKRGDPIRCKECGHRVLYKERTKRFVSFTFFFETSLWKGHESERMRGIGIIDRQIFSMKRVLTLACRMVQFEAR